MNAHYAEFNGGLGDVFHQIFTGPYWHLLRDLPPDDRVRCALICHNPYARELFEWHPKRAQIDLLNLGYWNVKDDRIYREKHNLPYPIPIPSFSPGPIDFYISDDEAVKLLEFQHRLAGKPYILFSTSAGLPDRTFPRHIAKELLAFFAQNACLVLVGRNYNREDRQPEWRIDRLFETRKTIPNVFDMVDCFSVPAIAHLLKGSAGLVTCHSALNLLGWHFRKPQLLLYPESVQQRHIIPCDGYAFGIHFPETVHGLFTEYTQSMGNQFLDLIRRLA